MLSQSEAMAGGPTLSLRIRSTVIQLLLTPLTWWAIHRLTIRRQDVLLPLGRPIGPTLLIVAVSAVATLLLLWVARFEIAALLTLGLVLLALFGPLSGFPGWLGNLAKWVQQVGSEPAIMVLAGCWIGLALAQLLRRSSARKA